MDDLRLLPSEPAASPQRKTPRWVDDFCRWAQGDGEPDLPVSLTPLAVLLALALLLQALQFYIPTIAALFREFNTAYRAHWMGFVLAKQWALFALLVAFLRSEEEGLSRIGFPSCSVTRWTLGVGLVAAAVFFAVGRAPVAGAGVARVDLLTPQEPVERLLYVGVALTAAVVEETIFRGFAVVWLYRWCGSLSAAVLVPAAVFAAGHAYAGALNVAVAFGAALLFSLGFVWRRDLYWPMVLHFLVDAAPLAG